MDSLILYRGDNEKIKSFEFKKTNSHCLVGQGIYLTDSLKIATSYRSKGVDEWNSGKYVLFHGEALNRDDAIEKAFSKFCEISHYKETGHYRYLKGQEALRYEKTCRAKWAAVRERGEIKADYVPVPFSRGLFGHSKPRSANTNEKQQKLRDIRVTWHECLVGYVTSFEFDQKFFNANVLHVDNPCRDPFFWTLMWENKISIGTPYDDLESYLKGNLGQPILQHNRGGPRFNEIADVLKPYGIIGFEYNGGMHLGGGHRRHRAFSIWDQDFVNEHKVERFR